MRADRAAGLLDIDEVQVFRSEDRKESIRLAEVHALRVRTRHDRPPSNQREQPFGPGHPWPMEAVIELAEGASGPRRRPLYMDVEGTDTREKVADLAYRLGSAMGLHHQRLVSGDPRRIEIEMRPEGGPGLATLPALDGPADSPDGRVSGAAEGAAAKLVAPPPDPTRFEGAARLTKWSLGDEDYS